jgi:hypothetical protein
MPASFGAAPQPGARGSFNPTGTVHRTPLHVSSESLAIAPEMTSFDDAFISWFAMYATTDSFADALTEKTP